MADKFQMQLSFDKDVSAFFVQLAQGELVMGFDINQPSPRTFDEHRPPVVIMDGGVAIDFATPKELHRIMESGVQASVRGCLETPAGRLEIRRIQGI